MSGFLISPVTGSIPGADEKYSGILELLYFLNPKPRIESLNLAQAVQRGLITLITPGHPFLRHRGDPLTWLVVDDDEDLSDLGTSDSYGGASMEATPPPPPHGHPHTGYARIYLNCSAKVGLGCRYVEGGTLEGRFFCSC